jgi:hypothetical protein
MSIISHKSISIMCSLVSLVNCVGLVETTPESVYEVLLSVPKKNGFNEKQAGENYTGGLGAQLSGRVCV